MKLDFGKIIIISGPSASGKSSLALSLAKENNGIIINADSMQIYKGLPILSAQPSDIDQMEIKHLLYSVLEPYEKCDVGLWLKLAKKNIDDSINQGLTPIIVGGTGMYISKLIYGISQIPEISTSARKEISDFYKNRTNEEIYNIAKKINNNIINNININDRQRLMRIIEIYKITGKSLEYFINLGNKPIYPMEKFYHINLKPNRELLYEKCEIRFRNMIKNDNVLNEIENFIKNYPNVIENISNFSISNTIGLTEGIKYIHSNILIEDFIKQSVLRTRNYIKRQYTWFNHQFEKFDLQI